MPTPAAHDPASAVVPDRAELERLSRDALIARAEEAGVTRANILTRPELVDELLLRAAAKDDPSVTKVRGFFGRARDLLARVIERGLHLPDAAEILRRAGAAVPPKRTGPTAVPTVTLAEIYAAQGHRARAIETLKRVLEHEADHAAARSLLTQLSTDEPVSVTDPLAQTSEVMADPGGPSPAHASERSRPAAMRLTEPPPSEAPPEPHGFLDDATLPPRYDVDECVAVSVDPTTLFTYWEIRTATLDHVRRTRPGGVVALRALIVTPTWDGPKSTTRDVDVVESLGDWFIYNLPPGAVVRVAIGWRTGGVFLPIAHSPAFETPPDRPSRMMADVWVRWTPSGAVALSPGGDDASGLAGPRGGLASFGTWAAGERPASGFTRATWSGGAEGAADPQDPRARLARGAAAVGMGESRGAGAAPLGSSEGHYAPLGSSDLVAS